MRCFGHLIIEIGNTRSLRFPMLLRRFAPVLLLSATLLTGTACHAAKKPIPPMTNDVALTTTHGKQTAVFAGGCFWGTQSVFERVKGVVKTTAGYSGGSANTAT